MVGGGRCLGSCRTTQLLPWRWHLHCLQLLSMLQVLAEPLGSGQFSSSRLGWHPAKGLQSADLGVQQADLSVTHLLSAWRHPVCRMKEGQTGIYYMAADSMDAAASAPFVEKLVQKGYEVRC